MTATGPSTPPPFIVTKEHRRFVEFANAVRKYRYIGLCYGAPGVGKTMSARQYASWSVAEPLVREWGPRADSDAKAYAVLARSRTVFYTAAVGATLRQIREELDLLMTRVGLCIEEGAGAAIDEAQRRSGHIPPIDLLIVDEAERLSTTGLEYMRDLFDRHGIGLILIGMPGIEKRMARYAQLYSRIGFAHRYYALQGEELAFVLQRHWKSLGLQLDGADFTDAQAMAAVARITGGNFRLLQRLFVQIERVLQVNELSLITDDVVETARSTLVIGAN